MNDIPMARWGQRLSVTLQQVLRSGDLDAALALVEQGDGMARNLAKEFNMMYRGLGITIRVMLPLLADLATENAAETALRAHFRRFAQEMNSLMQAAWQAPAITIDESLDSAALREAVVHVLADGEANFDRVHQAEAERIARAIRRGDPGGASALAAAKVDALYLPLHDRLVRFMADSMAFALRHGGEAGLFRFQVGTAEGQRSGFDKWELMTAEDFAKASAFLLKMHMGELTVHEDDQRYTLAQSLCGSGGRLQLGGAYEGPDALPYVETPGALTFGKSRLPVYCSHCPIWNGTATLAWYGRVHWLFEDPARPDGGCIAHIYKRAADAPEALVAPLRVPLAGA